MVEGHLVDIDLQIATDGNFLGGRDKL